MAADILTAGSATQRVTNGLNGLDGWINSSVFCAIPAVIEGPRKDHKLALG
jgi:hypothetical protein